MAHKDKVFESEKQSYRFARRVSSEVPGSNAEMAQQAVVSFSVFGFMCVQSDIKGRIE
jgi:hypothetical protein